MTRKQMKDQVVRFLGLQDITDYDETAMVDDWLYQGTIDMLARTKCTVRCVDLRTKAGQDEYKLDHSLLALVDVENGRRRARRDEYYNPSFTLVRSDVLILKPTPSEDGEVQVWGVLRPQQMTDDGQSPGLDDCGGIPDEYQDAIVTFALWKAADYSDDASSQMSERYRILYEGQDGRGGRLSQIRTMVNRRAPRAPRSRVSGLLASSSRDSWVG